MNPTMVEKILSALERGKEIDARLSEMLRYQQIIIESQQERIEALEAKVEQLLKCTPGVQRNEL